MLSTIKSEKYKQKLHWYLTHSLKYLNFCVFARGYPWTKIAHFINLEFSKYFVSIISIYKSLYTFFIAQSWNVMQLDTFCWILDQKSTKTVIFWQNWSIFSCYADHKEVEFWVAKVRSISNYGSIHVILVRRHV